MRLRDLINAVIYRQESFQEKKGAVVKKRCRGQQVQVLMSCLETL